MQPNGVEQYLNGLFSFLNQHPELSTQVLHKLADNCNQEKSATGCLLAAANAYRNGERQRALDYLQQHIRKGHILPTPALLWMIVLRDTLGQCSQIPSDFLNYASSMSETPPLNYAAEAVSIAMVEDAKSHLNLIQNPAACRQAANVYETISRQLPAVTPTCKTNRSHIHVGIIAANLVDHIVAYSNRTVFFARYLDTKRFRLFVYSSENMCQRQRLLPFPYAAPPSTQTAPEYLQEFSRRNIPVWLTPRNTDVVPAAQQLAQRITDDQIDILIIQSGTTMPIDWIASRLADVPVKMQIHIGLSALQPGLDTTLFDNEKNMLREKQHWPSECGNTILVRRGTDIEAIDRTPALRRSDLNLPQNAILIGVLSNHLATRLSPEYLQAIGCVLKKHPQAHFTAIGGAEMPIHVIQYAQRENIHTRIHHIPARHDAPAVLKTLDIYAAEFPASGSQAIIEAMACGLPVAALCAGDTHYASIGGDLIGPDALIDPPTTEAYSERISQWISSPKARQLAGSAMRQRAENCFHVKDFVDRVCRIGEEFLVTKKGR